MDLQPTLRGELLELRPIRPDDFEELFRVGSDPLIWEQHPEHDRWTEPVFRRFFDGALECRGGLVALDRATGAMIGSSRYFGYDAERSVVEIGWSFLARAYWGGKYNGEMKRLMLENAFKGVERVIFIIGEENRRSRRAVEKIGAVLSTIELGARGANKVIYELTRARYLK
jgi:RimJ/RimL family protein N-acetyltransferase